jgi:hypothetical protein
MRRFVCIRARLKQQQLRSAERRRFLEHQRSEWTQTFGRRSADAHAAPAVPGDDASPAATGEGD